ncbi:MAG: PIN domain-containing protein [Verrucomicrobia bacterium]|nr:PIN domain-containing protein [Verrucomicrobiota bacterium]MBT7066481.1 PIN domain-containing protein [Verrucomicrobiota bacterium]MBT7698957.1 PIN domain-containing protein [Verrucomicrobiota bacterium]
MRVLVDTNVLLDVIAAREPFYQAAARLWSLAEHDQIEAFVSAISFNNVFYIVRKSAGKEKADEALRAIRDLFTPVPLDATLINRSMDAPIDDFEDAVQFHSASRENVDYLVTRDPDGFPHTGVAILSPHEFLAIWDAREEQDTIAASEA